jgi:hypothetical protein
MEHVISNSPKRRALIWALAILCAAVLFGLVFAMWVQNGPQILMALGSSALAWCF